MFDYWVDFALVAANEDEVLRTCRGKRGGYFCADRGFAGAGDEN